MPLRITKSTDVIEVKNLTACIYAPPGVGKSTLGFTADRPLLLDFDKGSYRAGNRRDTVQVESWNDVTNITAEDLAPYGTLVVDTAGRALDALTAYIIAENPKMGRGGALTLQGFGELKAKFIAWTKMIRGFGLDVVLLSHADEQRNGDELIERLDIQGGSKNEIYKAADVMGRLNIKGGKRTLNFSPTDTSFGKNPAQLPALEVPHFAKDPSFLAGVLERIKGELNKLSEDQTKAASLLADWKAKIDEAKSAEDFTGLLPKTREADPLVRENVQRMFAAAAKAKGLKWDKEASAFAPEQKAA
jgi:hypothetical protein